MKKTLWRLLLVLLNFPIYGHSSKGSLGVRPQAKMNQDGFVSTPKCVWSLDSAYLAVAKGILSAGGRLYRALTNTSPEAWEPLNTLWGTPRYTPPPPFATSTNFKRIVQAEERDWDDVNAIDTSRLTYLLEQ
ncbi:hypothetical protein HC752_11435 [Vibrio sp. S9_S30]|uniref:hypothetical protein n=1 Tax=Vibrio sp. S9_S30 TaxID=2720226 RepID=UPI001680FB97|nr:hypothetical protein [Vibrio sp. S9_S30]MBD1557542.1 hypothetical protein [Vibrio sp. S9_S30]